MVEYGRYVVCYDPKEHEWRADPKAKGLMVDKKWSPYTFPESKIFTSPYKEGLYHQMKKEGASGCVRRKGEWVVFMDGN